MILRSFSEQYYTLFDQIVQNISFFCQEPGIFDIKIPYLRTVFLKDKPLGL